MTTAHTICAICAWRATCNKKFSVDGTTTTKCPEFTRDVTLKAPQDDDTTDPQKQGKN